MKNALINTLLRKSIVGVFYLLSLSTIGVAQNTNELCENEFELGFTGPTSPTLCQQYSSINFEILIGSGTLITHSSQINLQPLQKVRIVGNFFIDNDFSIISNVFKIDANVRIVVEENNSLTINDSKLFSCNGLWEGIIMEDFTSITTKNSTIIEDARAAIQSINRAYVTLEIENTTFNRNRIGILLENLEDSPHTPVIFKFIGNSFECRAPLNSSSDERSAVGVKIRNVYNAFLNNPNNTNNTFQNILNGIIAEGNSTDLYIYGFKFTSITNVGIEFRGRHLKVENSIFNSIHKNGIWMYNASELELSGNKFYLRAITPIINTRYMVIIEAFDKENKLNIENNYFYSEAVLNNNLNMAISINTYSIAKFHGNIYDNTFDLFNASGEIPGPPCWGINLFGNWSNGSNFNIEYNHFNLNTYIAASNVGIRVSGGTKSHLRILNNDFRGSYDHIRIQGSDSEYSSEVSGNKIYQSSAFGTLLFVKDFQNVKVCSNSDFAASNVSFLFNGSNNNMSFIDNITYGGVQQSLWLSTATTVIGQQGDNIHGSNGNKWFPGYRPSQNQYFIDYPEIVHASSDLNQIEMSKFFVNTPQSTFQGGQYQYFSEYHPFLIFPDQFPLVNSFFEHETVNLAPACISRLYDPADKGDINIADGTYDNLINSPALGWDGKRYLYSKLLLYPDYEQVYSGFSNFLDSHSISNVGKFYSLEKEIHSSVELPDSLADAIEAANEQIEILDEVLFQYIERTNYNSDSLYHFLENRFLHTAIINSALQLGDSLKEIKLINALNMLQTISPSLGAEELRKDVFDIYLQSQLYQNGVYDSLQIEALQDIASSCSNESGMVVYTAQGLLPKCDLYNIQEKINSCNQDSIEFRSSDLDSSKKTSASNLEAFSYYPNPTKGTIVLKNLNDINGSAQILTLTGQIIETFIVEKGESSRNLKLPSGIYLLRVSFPNGESISQKLIIN